MNKVKNPHAVALGKLGQKAWMQKTTPEWRKKNAKRANSMRKANR